MNEVMHQGFPLCMCLCGIEVIGCWDVWGDGEQVQPQVRAVVEYGGLGLIFCPWLPASWREFFSLFCCVEVIIQTI